MANSEDNSARDTRLLLLAPEDNVCCACVDIPAGAEVRIDGQTVVVDKAIPVGFKIARNDLKNGDRILKYGAPIGRLTHDVRRGEMIHTHNLRSDYLPTYTLGGDDRYLEGEQ